MAKSDYYLRHLCLSARNTAADAGEIVVQFYVGDFLLNSV